MKKVFITLLVSMLFSTICFADYGGILSVTSSFDVSSSDDLNVYDNYVAGWFSRDDVSLYAMLNEDGTVYFEEAYIKFNSNGLRFNLGKVIVPFGFEKLNRPQTSVFITSPKSDLQTNALNISAKYGILDVDGSYVGNGDWALRAALRFFDGYEKIMVSYSNIDSYENDFLISNKFIYESLLLNVSSLTELGTKNGDFWSRLVLSPGIFDVFGFMLAYYNVDEMGTTLNSWDYSPDAWSYGFYFDISYKATASVEWKDDKAFNPIVVKLMAKF